MDTTTLKKFAQGARRQLLEQVSARMEQVLRTDSVEIREKAKVVEQLKAEIEAHGKKKVIDRVAYTWFNRFCALRFMDVNHYTRIGAVSPVEGGTQPEVLLEAKQGHVDEELARFVNPQVIFSLLNGQRPASDPQGEAYRLLLVGVCNSYSEVMPFLFEKIEDYTELLMPLDLLSENSALHDLREALTPEACVDVEVIGWLYQYYISERKDKVFEALKQNQKIEAGDIPAATQLFTPHWIVRYLVENSLGRLWMLNHPNSGLREKMEYYIAPADDDVAASRVSGDAVSSGEGVASASPRNDMLVINSPEELRLLDPACGSGHILTYAFDLLAAIYEEEGYASSDVAKLILEKNLFGVEIDPRAGALAAFALVMKARAKDRRFFTRDVSPNICVLENVSFNDAELKQYISAVGHDLFTEPLMETLRQFEQADNFGSLIRPMLPDAGYVRGLLEGKNLGGDLFLFGVHERVLKVLKMAEFLAPRYHVATANPPYMGSAGMNEDLKTFANNNYLNGSADTYGCFIERCLNFVKDNGFVGMITIPNWMFLEAFSNLRDYLIENTVICSLIHNGRGVFGSDFGSCSFIIRNHSSPTEDGYYKRLFLKQGEVNSNEVLEERFFDNKNFQVYRSPLESFVKIPGSPIAYWVSHNFLKTFDVGIPLGKLAPIKSGMASTDNNRFLRFWSEISFINLGLNIEDINEAKLSKKKWFPYKKGGEFRRWYGNDDLVLNWYNDGEEIKTAVVNNPKDPKTTHWSRRIFGVEYFFKPGITWTSVSISKFSCRYHFSGHIFSNASNGAFPQRNPYIILALLNSLVGAEYLNVLSPTVNYKAGDLAKIPVLELPQNILHEIENTAEKLIRISNEDWDTSELSWNFEQSPVLRYKHATTIKGAYDSFYNYWKNATLETQRLEQINNQAFINLYGLNSELSSNVPLEDISLTCNPYYRYGGKKSKEELEELLRADTMKEFISYAVGCMFGRYSLDKPGLVLANQGETLKDYIKKVCSGEWEVGSLSTTHYPLSTDENVTKGELNHDHNSSQLQRVDRLAESNGSGGNDLSGNQTVSKGRTVRSDKSGQAFGSVDSIEHSGRTSQKINGGISEILVNCERFKSRDGDPNPACPALELCNERYRAANSQPLGGSKQNVAWVDEQSQQVSSRKWKVDGELPTPHCPLSTVTFLPDEDNVIPVLEGEWFEDDIAERFKKFLRVTFGEEHYDENLAFIEEAIGRDVRSYFVKEFYKDHVQTYKKRPIYWMFSSPKGSFNALIYMHRYQPDTVSIVLNGYLREYIKKLSAHKSQLERTSVSGSASQSQKTKALKEIQQVNKVLSELKEYEDDVLYPLATERVSIDLDDGVKVNYGKFGEALSPIKGL